MSDEAIIARFMEPVPLEPPSSAPGWSLGRWWAASPSPDGPRWVARPLTLDRLWHVEQRLISGERRLRLHYDRLLQQATGGSRYEWHSDAPTRIVALAAVLRDRGAEEEAK